MVIFIHGYFATVDQAWTDDHLEEQFQASGRNALFVAIEAPVSNFQEVVWKSLDELLRTVQDSSPFPLPHGALVIMGHSGAFRTILLWLRDPRVHYVTLLDGLYSGLGEFRYWLHPRYATTPPRMVLVASDTWRQSNLLARRIYGTARRRGIPATASSFTPRETTCPPALHPLPVQSRGNDQRRQGHPGASGDQSSHGRAGGERGSCPPESLRVPSLLRRFSRVTPRAVGSSTDCG